VKFKGLEYSYRIVLRNDPCPFCGEPSETIDHIHPNSLGGPNGWGNTVGTCARCNNAKNDDSLLGFLLGEELTERWYKPLAGSAGRG
jgi:5-methylcytosine-specific restriction endonuclease McrA